MKRENRREEQEKKKERRRARDGWSLVLLVFITATLVFIWTNSMEAPAESSEKSQWVMKLLTPVLELFVGKGNVTEFLVRKLAHFCEFGLLGCELSLMLILRKCQTLQWYVNVAMFAFTVAVLDETIQIFADRGSSLADVWLDTAGAVTGIVGVWMLYTLGNRLVCRVRQKRSLRNVRALRETAREDDAADAVDMDTAQ